MDTLAKSDIFFFISSISFVIITIAIVFMAFHVVKILKDLQKFVKKAAAEGERIVEDITYLRENVKRETMKVPEFLKTFLVNLFIKRRSGKK